MSKAQSYYLIVKGFPLKQDTVGRYENKGMVTKRLREIARNHHKDIYQYTVQFWESHLGQKKPYSFNGLYHWTTALHWLTGERGPIREKEGDYWFDALKRQFELAEEVKSILADNS